MKKEAVGGNWETEKPAQWHVFDDAVVTPGTKFLNHHL